MIEFLKNHKKLSFKLGGVSFEALSYRTEVLECGNCVKTVYTFDCGLKLTNTFNAYPEYGACDWVNEWENTSVAPSEIISELWDCDVEFPFAKSSVKETGRAYLPQSENVVKVYAPRGSNWSYEEFYCAVDRLAGNRYDNWLSDGQKKKYFNTGGRSAESNASPFFNIKHGRDDYGIIAAIGWTGQWNAEVERRETSVIFKSKIEDTSFRLMPGERIRTSSVTMLEYKGTVAYGQNRWRRLVKDVYSPIGKGGVPALAPFCAGLWGGMSSDGCVERIRKVENAGLPFDHYWMDAGWYGSGTQVSPDEYEGDWSQHTGDWEINKVRHPDMMENVVAEIAKGNKRFLLWFEPERVRRNAPIFTEHPEYLLMLDNDWSDTLLNLGNEDAWNYCFNTLSEMIERLKISVYRQDFNFSPLPYWRRNDAEDRRGITEIKHINGLYRLWDALLERFPYLLIDNCASGGRRIDIETLRRSIPLWRSDAQCPADPIPEMAQAHSLCHGMWMPYSGTGTGRIWYDTYRFRSAYAPALTTNFTFSERNAFGDDPEGMKWLARMCDEYVRVRPYLSEDAYQLTVPSEAMDVWSAIQYHDPSKDEGVIQVFRRGESPYEEAVFKLFGLDGSSEYIFEDADGGEFSAGGMTLLDSGLKLRIPERRAAKVYFYKNKASVKS